MHSPHLAKRDAVGTIVRLVDVPLTAILGRDA
jgi:hypothetical protein